MSNLPLIITIFACLGMCSFLAVLYIADWRDDKWDNQKLTNCEFSDDGADPRVADEERGNNETGSAPLPLINNESK